MQRGYNFVATLRCLCVVVLSFIKVKQVRMASSVLSSVAHARIVASDVGTATLTPLLSQFNSGVDGVLARQTALRECLVSLSAGS